MDCLDEDTLLAFLAGRLRGSAALAAREHIAQCESCRAIATDLIRDAAANVRHGSAPRSYELAQGSVIADRYRLVRPIGEGGMGLVWEATALDRPTMRVAIKLLKSFDASARRRFLREIATTAALVHPSLVRVVDVLEDVEANTPALVMELLSGASLRDRLACDGRLGRPEAIAIARSLAGSLSVVHSAGFVHRDVKPANVQLTADRSRPVVLLDLGLAKSLWEDSSSLTRTGQLVGTPAYMAPEQLAGDRRIEASADVWSLGIILYECLTGARPFAGRTVAELLAAASCGLPAAPMDREVHDVLSVLLAPDPASRLTMTGAWSALSALNPS